MKRLIYDLAAGFIAAVSFAVITVGVVTSPRPGFYLPLYLGVEFFTFIFFGIPGAGLAATAASMVALGVLIIAGSGLAVASGVGYWGVIYILGHYSDSISREGGKWSLEIENIEKETGSAEVEISDLERLTSALKEKLKRYNRLAEFAIRLSTTLDYEELYTYIKSFLGSVFPGKKVSMLRKPSDGYDRWVRDKKHPLLVENLSKDYRFEKPGPVDTVSLIGAPLLLGGSVSAIVRIESGSESFTSADLRLLGAVSSLSAISLENIRLFLRTQELAITDSLTGLYTHSYFKERLREEVERAARYRERFSVIMMDLDKFKDFNDTYGHPAGDEVLRKVSAEVKKAVRETDIAGRYGGEEFGVILRNIEPGKAKDIAERIRSAVEACSFDFCPEDRGITASLGVSFFPRSVTPDELIRTADDALYESKRCGRNRVSVSDE